MPGERRLQERTGDAWASGGEEGRGKLRKGAGIRKQELIRACPNGETRRAECPPPDACPGRTQGTETSKYLQEEKETSIPSVAASEGGRAQTGRVEAHPG